MMLVQCSGDGRQRGLENLWHFSAKFFGTSSERTKLREDQQPRFTRKRLIKWVTTIITTKMDPVFTQPRFAPFCHELLALA